jgi:hypothetical protein
MEKNTLSTMQRNALCRLFGRKAFTPEEVARLDYVQVERLPKIGKKGIESIRSWLHGYGYDLSNLPADQNRISRQRLQARLENAERLLTRHGYRIEHP